MEKKYELVTPYTLDGKTMWRLRALRDIPQPDVKARDVHAGDLGGWVSGEQSLSQDGDCWVFDGARVHDNARVEGNARLGDNAEMTGNARISGNARVGGCTLVTGNAVVDGNAYLHDWAQVGGNAHITDNAHLHNAYVTGDVVVDGDADLGIGVRLGETPDENVVR